MGQSPASQNRLTKGSCAIEETSFLSLRPAMTMVIRRDSSGCIAEHGKQFRETKPSSCRRQDLAVTSYFLLVFFAPAHESLTACISVRNDS